MNKIISIHEYFLKPGVDENKFVTAIRNTRDNGLLQLSGLEEYYFVKGIRGLRKGLYTAIWIYESKEAWEKLWGPLEKPLRKEDYPENWKVWENEILAPFLDSDPDEIRFTSYLELK